MTQAESATVILASQSPRRAALLQQIDMAFEVLPAKADEPPPQQGEAAVAYTMRTAIHKAHDVKQQLGTRSAWVMSADTIVTIDGQILGKPTDATDAVQMLRRLSGRKHQVVTAFAITHTTKDIERVESTSTDVQFRTLTDEQIQAYVATGEPLDKAGSYGIQGRAAVFVKGIEGCYFNVVGLPLGDLVDALTELGFPF